MSMRLIVKIKEGVAAYSAEYLAYFAATRPTATRLSRLDPASS